MPIYPSYDKGQLPGASWPFMGPGKSPTATIPTMPSGSIKPFQVQAQADAPKAPITNEWGSQLDDRSYNEIATIVKLLTRPTISTG